MMIDAVSVHGGHLGSNLGAVELTLALHRVFESPRDAIVWDTGHQTYVHKLVTGRLEGFARLRQGGGMSGYPSRTESEHDIVENSHASTAVSYAYGLAIARDATGAEGEVVAVIGDGALTGGLAYEALNNFGHSGRHAVIVLNDNGRCYAPTVSRLHRGPGCRSVGVLPGARARLHRADRRARHRRARAGAARRRRRAAGRSSCTCSPARARGTSPRRPTRRSASTTSARSTPRPVCRWVPTGPRTPGRSALR